MSTQESEIIQRVQYAYEQGTPLRIVGGGSKYFYGRKVNGEPLVMSEYSGVMEYEPTELYITARAGTLLTEIEQVLAEQGQYLPFEAPCLDGSATTLGGVIASGLAGPRRPYTGSIRDFVLGIRCANGKGELLRFGGHVIKNVAGYDISRLMTGAMGTLGVILEVTIKVMPKPEYEISLAADMGFDDALQYMHRWAATPLPISGACYTEGVLRIRLSGKQASIKAAKQQLGLVEDSRGIGFWQGLRNFSHGFFKEQSIPLWRLSLPSNTGKLDLPGYCFIDWGGAQRWLLSDLSGQQIRERLKPLGGHASLFRGGDQFATDVFAPLPATLHNIHQRLKRTFDPKHILNPGRMYPDI